ncbi:MAG: hypothetical protein FJZ47_10645 [Candidatus Tectomicrobia bacterium]|uniref:DUF7700 domain-containing protein n=1 Tax=Tectimicrobiota bacterium TaxID=2528274 RepID=A0A938B3Z1_UNCTE|nr:hypothetical protein [Candidatus Tectomicrobia bacterium]
MMPGELSATMGGETSGPEELIPAGAVTFGLEYRMLPGRDEGLCIHVYGNAMTGQDKALLRFDCFAVHPHYHYRNATVRTNERLELADTAEGDPLAWTLDKIKHRLPVMLMRGEAEHIAREMDQRDIDAALPKIVAWAATKAHLKGSRQSLEALLPGFGTFVHEQRCLSATQQDIQGTR